MDDAEILHLHEFSVKFTTVVACILKRKKVDAKILHDLIFR